MVGIWELVLPESELILPQSHLLIRVGHASPQQLYLACASYRMLFAGVLLVGYPFGALWAVLPELCEESYGSTQSVT